MTAGRDGADDGAAMATGDGWLDAYLPYLLYRVSGRMNARLQSRLAQAGLNLSQWRVLSVLRSVGRQSIGGIVDHSLMEQSTVSRVVNAMHEEGYVERRASPGDSRVVEVSLTAKGRDTFDLIGPAAVRHQQAALVDLTPDEIATLRALLQRIEVNLVEGQ